MKIILAALAATLATTASSADCKRSVEVAWKCVSETCVFAYTPDGETMRRELMVEKNAHVLSSGGYLTVCRTLAGAGICDAPIKGRIYSDEYFSPHRGTAEYSRTQKRGGQVDLANGLVCR